MSFYDRKAVQAFADKFPEAYVAQNRTPDSDLVIILLIDAVTEEQMTVITLIGKENQTLVYLIENLLTRQLNSKSGMEEAIAQLDAILDTEPSPLRPITDANRADYGLLSQYRHQLEAIHNAKIEWQKRGDILVDETGRAWFGGDGLHNVIREAENMKEVFTDSRIAFKIARALYRTVSATLTKYGIEIVDPKGL